MPSLYHFNSDQFKENLMLGGQQHMVAGRLCQYLKGWQLDGIRFLYKHFEKGEACILNDESGLGKVVTVSVFLGAILTNDTTKKCLIVVRDDEYIEGWRFHLNVLTQLTVKVIERTSDINYETVFLIKWSTLKNIGQIHKTNFDHVIIDNRGEMLTNKFCAGILLRYYENKASIVISSADVTADIKLLHTFLRLCGRLDKQYMDLKSFEDKFQLPKLKDGVCSKVDLEDYFQKREKVINFCREFRLRRYCHQFDAEFPLVPCAEFKRHLEQWRNNGDSQSSGSVKLLSSSSEKDIEELFKEYFQVKEERKTHKLDYEVQQITEHMATEGEDGNVSDEVVVMSPLLFVSESESDSEQTQVQIETSNKFEEEVKKENAEQNGGEKTSKEQGQHSPVRNRRKSTKPLKCLTRSVEKLPSTKSLRSRTVSKRDSPSPFVKKSKNDTVHKGTSKDTNTTGKTGRKPKLNIKNDEITSKRLKDEQLIRNERRKAKERDDERRTVDRRKTGRKEDRDAKRIKGVVIRKVDKIMQDNAISRDEEETSKEKLIKHEKDKRKSKEQEKGTPKKTSEMRKKKTQIEEEIQLGKEEVKDMKKQAKDVKTNNANEEKKTIQRRAKLKENKESEIVGEGKQQKKKKPQDEQQNIHQGDNERKQADDDLSRNKLTKEKENKRSAKKHIESENEKNRKTYPKSRIPHGLHLVLYEAKKFMNNKRNSSTRTAKEDVITKRTKNNQALDKSKVSTPTTSPKINTSSPKTSSKPHKPQEIAIPSTKSSIKDKVGTSKRGKPLTVYTPLGVHSRSTRGMERYTRSCPIKNKYMKVAVAQVDVDKKSMAKRLLHRRQSLAATKIKPRAIVSKPPTPPSPTPPPPPDPLSAQISESPAALESMQLGQVLSEANGPIVPDFTVPTPKNVDYNFPLMLDKDIPDSECVVTSQTKNNNEVIILTGSSITDNEMEPPKSTVSRRKTTAKPPMVTIPRPFYDKAKSPDLFSTYSDLSLPCSQQRSNKSHFDGFKIFGSELKQSSKQRSCLDILERMLEPRNAKVAVKKHTPPNEQPTSSPQQHCIEDEDAMFEISSNGTFGNVVRVNSNGEMSPVRKGQSTPPSAAHKKNRITNYLISNNQHMSGAPTSSSLEETTDALPKTPKRRKSLSTNLKRSPRSLGSGIGGAKSQSTKLTQWLVKNSVVRISETLPKPLAAKRRRLDLSFPDN